MQLSAECKAKYLYDCHGDGKSWVFHRKWTLSLSSSNKNEVFNSRTIVIPEQEIVFADRFSLKPPSWNTLSGNKNHVLLPEKGKKSGSRDVMWAVTFHPFCDHLSAITSTENSQHEWWTLRHELHGSRALSFPCAFYFLHTRLKQTPKQLLHPPTAAPQRRGPTF